MAAFIQLGRKKICKMQTFLCLATFIVATLACIRIVHFYWSSLIVPELLLLLLLGINNDKYFFLYPARPGNSIAEIILELF